MDDLIFNVPSEATPATTRWRKPCPPSVVLFATDGQGTVCIVDYQGPHSSYIMDESMSTRSFIDRQLAAWQFPGLWVWEGVVESYTDYWGEHDEEYIGDIRPLTEDESRAIRDDDYVWDSSLWIEPDIG